MKPLSLFTTPCRLICPISRHFFPVEHPEPVGCCTTGLKKGSRLPFIAHFFSSGFGLAASGFASATGFVSGTALTTALAVSFFAAFAAGVMGSRGFALAAVFAVFAGFTGADAVLAV